MEWKQHWDDFLILLINLPAPIYSEVIFHISWCKMQEYGFICSSFFFFLLFAWIQQSVHPWPHPLSSRRGDSGVSNEVGLNNVPLLTKNPPCVTMGGIRNCSYWLLWSAVDAADLLCFTHDGTRGRQLNTHTHTVFMMQPVNLSMTAKRSHRNPLQRRKGWF